MDKNAKLTIPRPRTSQFEDELLRASWLKNENAKVFGVKEFWIKISSPLGKSASLSSKFLLCNQQ